jgi:hypothetical protein
MPNNAEDKTPIQKIQDGLKARDEIEKKKKEERQKKREKANEGK